MEAQAPKRILVNELRNTSPKLNLLGVWGAPPPPRPQENLGWEIKSGGKVNQAYSIKELTDL